MLFVLAQTTRRPECKDYSVFLRLENKVIKKYSLNHLIFSL